MTRCIDGGETWRGVDSFTSNFTTSLGAYVGPKTENFTQLKNMNATQWRIHWEIFTKILESTGSFMLGQLIKFEWIRSKGSRVGGFKLTGCIFNAP